ncbi:Protein of unknown function (DUF2959) [Opitutaceae bacterium TAV1]|nr:Protein of unknown function (DUF2959) [Opitutaceae bacterium TAV1]
MKIIRILTTVTGLAISAAALTFAGCSSSGSSTYKKSENAAASLQSSGDALVKARAQIDSTLASLNNLVNTPAADLTKQYQAFVKQFSSMESAAKAVNDSAASMRAKADNYIATWGTQVAAIQNPELRAASLDRRAEVSGKLQKLVAEYAGVSETYKPFQQSLSDIRQVLGADLTTKGLDTVKPYVSKATADSVPLKASLDKLVADFKTLGSSLLPSGPAAAAAAQ